MSILKSNTKPINRIKTLLHVYAELNQIEYDDAVIKFISEFKVSRRQLSWWENNSAQPELLLRPHIAKFFNRKESEVFINQ